MNVCFLPTAHRDYTWRKCGVESVVEAGDLRIITFRNTTHIDTREIGFRNSGVVELGFGALTFHNMAKPPQVVIYDWRWQHAYVGQLTPGLVGLKCFFNLPAAPTWHICFSVPLSGGVYLRVR